MTDYSRLPAHMQDAARRYVEQGIPPGSFLTAVLTNDFIAAFRKADAINQEAMLDWAIWLDNEAPRACHGRPELVQEWIKAGGLAGRTAECQ